MINAAIAVRQSMLSTIKVFFFFLLEMFSSVSGVCSLRRALESPSTVLHENAIKLTNDVKKMGEVDPTNRFGTFFFFVETKTHSRFRGKKHDSKGI